MYQRGDNIDNNKEKYFDSDIYTFTYIKSYFQNIFA